MAVRIRLLRTGRKKKPSYRIVVMDSRIRRDGRYLEKVGTYYPLNKPAEVNIDKEKVLKWLEKGAEPSQTVFNLLQKEGIALDWHLIRNKASEQVRHIELQKFELAKKVRADNKSATATETEAEKKEAQKEGASPAEAPEKEAVPEEAVSSEETADAEPEIETAPEEQETAAAEEPVNEEKEGSAETAPEEVKTEEAAPETGEEVTEEKKDAE
ncbi:MAG TPA: 30S ribosomal protein S16 [Candidatus Marinimicrobia bacterium]|nr:30S ribosomal protein S16 [Candidatus Neomarinimicrobiota bacterium]